MLMTTNEKVAGSVRLPLLQKVNRMDRYGGYACRRRQHDRYASIKKKAE
jgi:hypothetical protein